MLHVTLGGGARELVQLFVEQVEDDSVEFLAIH
jgi:hypothetical protein